MSTHNLGEVRLLSLDACKALKKMGYPQGRAHFRWYWWAEGELLAKLQPPEVSCPGAFGSGVWYDSTAENAEPHIVLQVDCPQEAEVIYWLEEMGYGISRLEFGGWYAGCPPYPPRESLPPHQSDPLLTFDELVLAICAHKEGV